MRWTLLGAAVVVVACRSPEPAAFRYLTCCPGCETTTPMMLGDEEDVVVTGSVPDSVSVESTAPSVVSVSHASRTCCPIGTDAATAICRDLALTEPCDSKETTSLALTVDGLGEGSSELQVKDSDGAVWGSVSLSVEKAATLTLACNMQGTVTLARGESCPVTVSATDANGMALMSAQGIFVESGDDNVVVFDILLELNQSGAPVSGCQNSLNGVDMFATGPGDAVVTATAGDASETLAVHVTP